MKNSCICQFAEDFKKSTSYITQDDRLQLLLTVIENMRIAADLKLGGSVSRIEKNKRVSNTICCTKFGVGAKALKYWNIDVKIAWSENLLLMFYEVKWEFN